MKQIKQLIALFLLFALTLSLGACGGDATPTATVPSTEPATEPPITAESLYSDAMAALEASEPHPALQRAGYRQLRRYVGQQDHHLRRNDHTVP